MCKGEENNTGLTVGAGLLLLFAPSPVFAYLDPGSGSMLLYALASIGALIAYSVRNLIFRLGNLLAWRGARNARAMAHSDLVFWSEHRQYWPVFEPVIRALDARGVRCVYLASDKLDQGLDYSSENVVSKFIGGVSLTAATLNHLSARMVVMTTPQLGIFRIKRSPRVAHYCNLIHAPTGVLAYKRFAFDHFDSVLCSGPHQVRTIRTLERVRGTPPKGLFETGLTYYDGMISLRNHGQPADDQITVMIAPTWGDNGLLRRFGPDLVIPLLQAGFKVILRPHPQSYVSERKLMERVERELQGLADFEIDREVKPDQAMARSNLLISDLSGIIFDFGFVFSRPVITLDSEIEIHGREAEYVDRTIWELSARSKLGPVVDERGLEELPALIRQLVQKHQPGDLEQFREESLYNFGKAGPVAADHIQQILGELE